MDSNAALSEILARDQAAGVDVFDDGRREPRAPGPFEVLQPLLPPMIPPPDWRAEQEAVARRDAEDLRRSSAPEPDPEPPPPESLQARPAKKRRRRPEDHR